MLKVLRASVAACGIFKSLSLAASGMTEAMVADRDMEVLAMVDTDTSMTACLWTASEAAA
jgi:hypothetical protein